MNYSSYSRFLHRMIFNSFFLRKALFNLELDLFAGDPLLYSGNKHVFISGLARSGTTSLMQKFYETGRFRSLTYRDMPFVLSPNLWKKIYPAGNTNTAYEERAHGDGIMVGFDSPEAFEEVFWKLCCGDDYIKDQFLIPHAVSQEIIGLFRSYIEVVIKSENQAPVHRYLSKNNNNILRIPSIFEAFPNAVVLTPFRDPLTHAASLLSQHSRFLEINAADGFGRDYMNWLGHHEFGANHKPFYFGPDSGALRLPGNDLDVNYWLEVWFNYYQFALDHYPDRLIFISFEQLCEEPRRIFGALGEITDTGFDLSEISPFVPPAKAVSGADPDLLEKCRALYSRLMAAVLTTLLPS